jgi:hypothetical protein
MLYLLCDRAEWLKLLPKGGRWAEIGAFRGENAARLLDHCAPSELHLIDPWKFELDFDWFNPPAWSPRFGDAARFVRQLSDWAKIPEGLHVNEFFEELYAQVAAQFATDQRVKIHRATSRAAAPLFRDGYFDFIYLDGAHDYETVLADLQLYHPKLNENGAILGDDYCEHGSAENAQYGVIAAVNKFLKQNDPRLLLVNHEYYSFFALLNTEHPAGAELLQRTINSGIPFLELPDAIASNYHHKRLRRTDGSMRDMPSF